MSSPSETVYHAIGSTPSASLPAASAVADSPPIIHFARIAGHVFALSFSYLSSFSTTLAGYSLVPLNFAFTPIYYVLSPVIVFVQVLLEVFLFSPYAIITSVVRNIYPIYVFVGVACIFSALLGYVARMISRGLTYAVFTPRRPSATLAEDPAPDAAPPKATTPKTRVRRRVSIKEER
ncbi:hypothetical protein C2E23DRAFT_848165 [Lenzites betulinus]|nr:hypothetical protein C2E23DRAFT_848165 [Lenzites betulinus]